MSGDRACAPPVDAEHCPAMTASPSRPVRGVAESVSRLVSAGFSLAPLPNPFGGVDGVHATRLGGRYLDTVVIRTSECAVAAQVTNEFSPDDPLRKPTVAWSITGTASEVTDAILAVDHA